MSLLKHQRGKALILWCSADTGQLSQSYVTTGKMYSQELVFPVLHNKERNCLFSIVWSWLLCHRLISCNCVGLFMGSTFCSLIYICFMPAPYFDGKILYSFEPMKIFTAPDFFFFQERFGHFYGSTKFLKLFFSSVKKSLILISCIESVDYLGYYIHFNSIYFSIE